MFSVSPADPSNVIIFHFQPLCIPTYLPTIRTVSQACVIYIWWEVSTVCLYVDAIVVFNRVHPISPSALFLLLSLWCLFVRYV